MKRLSHTTAVIAAAFVVWALVATFAPAHGFTHAGTFATDVGHRSMGAAVSSSSSSTAMPTATATALSFGASMWGAEGENPELARLSLPHRQQQQQQQQRRRRRRRSPGEGGDCAATPAARTEGRLLPSRRGHHRPSSSSVVGPLRAIVDVPPGFFTTMFLALGVTNSLLRKIQREALEENAWRKRLDEARELRLDNDLTLTELDLIREEADARPRPYGVEAMERREREEREMDGRAGGRGGRRGRGPRILTIENAPGVGASSSSSSSSSWRGSTRGDGNKRQSSYKTASSTYRPMTDNEIDDFEVMYGVSYDPYYDEPYEEDELPTNVKYRVDRLYGDRRYEDGEIFYKDESTGLYWRQGCKPRAKKMWGFS